MSNTEFSELTGRIRQELEEIRRVLERISAGWERARRLNDDFYVDGVALNLHGFYSGFERIFTRIAETVDGELPRGDNWHDALLQQMMAEIPGIRPAVISSETGAILDEQRRFRHLVRNIYTYKLDPERVGILVESAQRAFPMLEAELLAFAAFLELE